MVLAYASGGDWDGLRITIGEPAANERVLEIAATLPRPVDR
jgi:histidinol-phosphate aminotransferase